MCIGHIGHPLGSASSGQEANGKKKQSSYRYRYRRGEISPSCLRSSITLVLQCLIGPENQKIKENTPVATPI